MQVQTRRSSRFVWPLDLFAVARHTCHTPNHSAAGSSIYGPFEDGFGSQQDFLITGFGCSDPSLCYSDGGIDTQMAEAACAKACDITLPRWGDADDGDGIYVGFLDTCGGHASDFHFHQSMVRTVSTS